MNEELYKMSIKELSEFLGVNEAEAQRLKKSWGYKPPSNPEELKRHANKGSRYEHEMRGLNTDLREGRITIEQYHEREAQIRADIFGS